MDIHPDFIELIRKKTREDKANQDGGPFLVELGKQLAKLVGRKEPWSDSTVSRFLLPDDHKDAKVTMQMTRAFCLHYKLPDPILPVAAPEEIEWFWAGRDLRESDPALFKKRLEQLTRLASATRQKAKVIAEIEDDSEDT